MLGRMLKTLYGTNVTTQRKTFVSGDGTDFYIFYLCPSHFFPTSSGREYIKALPKKAVFKNTAVTSGSGTLKHRRLPCDMSEVVYVECFVVTFCPPNLH